MAIELKDGRFATASEIRLFRRISKLIVYRFKVLELYKAKDIPRLKFGNYEDFNSKYWV